MSTSNMTQRTDQTCMYNRNHNSRLKNVNA